MSDGLTRRELLRAAGAAALLTACIPQTGGPPASTAPASPAAPEKAGRYLLGKIEGPTIVTDPARFPKTFREAPELTALVQQGKLPAVTDRIGQDPLVVKPLHGIGKYGGTIRRGFIGVGDFQNMARFAAGPDSLLYYDHTWKTLIPNVARGFERSADGTELTIQLRRGMRWSDGAPLTADDILFWYEDILLNKDLVASPSGQMAVNGKPVVIRKVDQYTVRFISPEPNHLLPELLASWTDLGGHSFIGRQGFGGFAPKHYLQKFHPKYAGREAVDKLAADAKFAGWVTYFKNRNDWLLNAELPVVTPWKTRAGNELNKPTMTLERNPYSIWVDTDGNQLPYINEIVHSSTENIEVLSTRAIAGEYDFQDRHLDVAKLPLLLQNQERSGYDIHLTPGQATDFGIRINLSFDKDPEIGSLFRNVDFRRALSMAVDRDQINETFFLGSGIPTATLPAEGNRYFPGKEWRTKWATLDVAQADQLLDKIGLTQKDGDGYRLRRDGKGRIRLDYHASPSFADFPAIGEMIKQQWKRIGIDLNVQSVQGTITLQKTLSGEIQLSGHQVGSPDLFITPDTVIPFSTTNYPGMMGIPYAKWFHSGGKEGIEPFAEVKRAMELWRKGYGASEAERINAGKEIYRIHVDNVFTIGIVGQSLAIYGMYLAKRSLGNVPERVINTELVKSPSNALPQTFYFK